MNFFAQNRTSKIFMLSALFIILGVLLWNTTVVFERLKEVERNNMEVWAQSQKTAYSKNENDYSELVLMILTSNNTIPMVKLNTDGSVNFHKNIPEDITSDKEKFESYLNDLKEQNEPIIVRLPELSDNTVQFLYYKNSLMLTKIEYYPIAIIMAVILLVGMVYFFFSTSKISEQNKVWAGMAKETAHQLGTPMSALEGWMEILKIEEVNPDYIAEIKKDIDRLKIITDRFSKIGSIPVLKEANIVGETQEAYNYLKSRSSKLIRFELEIPENPVLVELNKPLYAWTIENLVKNAIDAMDGKGDLKIKVLDKKQDVRIQVIDTGSGISMFDFQKIFEPGHTNKRIGWGLGLSLAKRIIVDYHGGKIKVLESEIGKGSTFEIQLSKC